MPRFKPLNWTIFVTGMAMAAMLDLSIGQAATTASKEATPPSAFSFWPIYWQTRDSTAPQLLAQQQQPRTALIIGNAAYQDDRLANPVNDATDIAAALRSLGFEVTLLLDKDLRATEDALDTFNRQLQRGGVGVFYYAGHGVQVDGENYLIPLNARLNRQNDVRYEAIPLGRVLNAMEDSSAQVKVVMIDACRDNPFYRRWRSDNRTLSAQRGLAFEVPPEGTIISFATGPNDVAADGEGRNSPYTASLLRHINTPSVDINALFRAVRADVMNATSGRQVPWYQESLVGSFSFNASSTTPTPLVLPARPTPQPPRPTPPPQSTLISTATGINYELLRDALTSGDFRLADLATHNLMMEVAGIDPTITTQIGEFKLRSFPCDDLKIMNQLWIEHSNGRFGFSVQQEIYQSLGGTNSYDRAVAEIFGDQVGWVENNDWIPNSSSVYDLDAKRGHLPQAWISSWLWQSGLNAITSNIVRRDGANTTNSESPDRARGLVALTFLPVQRCDL